MQGHAFLSLVPFVGAAGVWLPASLDLFYVGPTWAAIFLALWGVFGISLVDNFLKPLLIGSKAMDPDVPALLWDPRRPAALRLPRHHRGAAPHGLLTARS